MLVELGEKAEAMKWIGRGKRLVRTESHSKHYGKLLCGEVDYRLASLSAFLILKAFMEFIADTLLHPVNHLMHIKYQSHRSPL